MQITLIVTEQELDLIWAGLAEIPYKHSAKLIQNLSQQYNIHKETKKDIIEEPLADKIN